MRPSVKQIMRERESLSNLREAIKLAEGIINFGDKMAEGVDAKIGRWWGWDEDENTDGMFARLLEKAREGKFVSVANFAMFLDHQNYKPKEIK